MLGKHFLRIVDALASDILSVFIKIPTFRYFNKYFKS